MTSETYVSTSVLWVSTLAALTFAPSNAAAIRFDPNPIPDTHIVFGRIVTEPLPFTVPCVVTPTSPQSDFWVSMDPLPFLLPCTYDYGSQSFNGTVPYLYNGQTVRIGFIIGEGSMPTTVIPGHFNLIVTPEPGSLSLLGMGAALARRQRR